MQILFIKFYDDMSEDQDGTCCLLSCDSDDEWVDVEEEQDSSFAAAAVTAAAAAAAKTSPDPSARCRSMSPQNAPAQHQRFRLVQDARPLRIVEFGRCGEVMMHVIREETPYNLYTFIRDAAFDIGLNQLMQSVVVDAFDLTAAAMIIPQARLEQIRAVARQYALNPEWRAKTQEETRWLTPNEDNRSAVEVYYMYHLKVEFDRFVQYLNHDAEFYIDGPLSQRLNVVNFERCILKVHKILAEQHARHKRQEAQAKNFMRSAMREIKMINMQDTIRERCVEAFGTPDGTPDDWCPETLTIEFMRKAVPPYHRMFLKEGSKAEKRFYDSVMTFLQTPEGIQSLVLQQHEFKPDLINSATWQKLANFVRMAASFMIFKKGEKCPYVFALNDSNYCNQQALTYGLPSFDPAKDDTKGIGTNYVLLTERFRKIDANAVLSGKAMLGERSASSAHLADIPSWWPETLPVMRMPDAPWLAQFSELLETDERWMDLPSQPLKTKPYFAQVTLTTKAMREVFVSFDMTENRLVDVDVEVPAFIAYQYILKRICTFVREQGTDKEAGPDQDGAFVFSPPADLSPFNGEFWWCPDWSWYSEDYAYMAMHPVVDNNGIDELFQQAIVKKDAVFLNLITIKSCFSCPTTMHKHVVAHPGPIKPQDIASGKFRIASFYPEARNVLHLDSKNKPFRLRPCGYNDKSVTFSLVPDEPWRFCDEATGQLRESMRKYAQLMLVHNFVEAGVRVEEGFLGEGGSLYLAQRMHGRPKSVSIDMFLGRRCQLCNEVNCLDNGPYNGRAETLFAFRLSELAAKKSHRPHFLLCHNCKQGKKNVAILGFSELLKDHLRIEELKSNIERDRLCIDKRRELQADEYKDAMIRPGDRGRPPKRKAEPLDEATVQAETMAKIKRRLKKSQDALAKHHDDDNVVRLADDGIALGAHVDYKFELVPLPFAQEAGFGSVDAVLAYCRSPEGIANELYVRKTDKEGRPMERLYKRYSSKARNAFCIKIMRRDDETWIVAGYYYFEGQDPAVNDLSKDLFSAYVEKKNEAMAYAREIESARKHVSVEANADVDGFLTWLLTADDDFRHTLANWQMPRKLVYDDAKKTLHMSKTKVPFRTLFVDAVCGKVDDDVAKVVWNEFCSVSAKEALVPWLRDDEEVKAHLTE